jgi:choice-of-anchor A domain-containing protein
MSAKLFVLALAGIGASAADATTILDYNLVVLGNFNGYNSDVQGKVAVKGNAAITSYSVGARASAGDNLVVGGNLTVGSGGGSTNGRTIVGGTVTTPSWGGYGNGGITKGASTLPIDFAAETARMTWLSDTLEGYATTGTIVQQWGQMFFTGTDPTLNVFNVTAAQMASSNTFHINVTSGSQVLFNISGLSASMQNAGFDLRGVDASKILYNFYDATSLSFSGIGVLGSVLAPDAAYRGGYGNVNGEMIVASFDAPTQINSMPYAGTLLGMTKPVVRNPAPVPGPVPEIATWAQMIAGFGCVGAILRRYRRQQQRRAI